LIPLQKFYPSSCDLLFISSEKKVEFKYATLFSLEKNGFAFGYEKSDDNYHVISSAYGIKSNQICFGSGINVFLKKKEDPTAYLSLSSSFISEKIFNKCALSINRISLVEHERFEPEIVFDIDGEIPLKIKIQYNVSLLSICKIDSIKKSPLEGKIDFLGSIGNRSMFMYSLGYEGLILEKDLSNSVNIGIGSLASILESGVGLFFGYSYNVNTKSNTIECNINFNPFQNRDLEAPFVSMNVKCSEIGQSGYYFSLRCSDNSNGSGIKSWALVVSDIPSKNGKVIKIFSGGLSVPSSVFWNLKNNCGLSVDTLTTYTRFICVDNSNNIGYTDWIILNPIKRKTN
jgi:hypothetical protein